VWKNIESTLDKQTKPRGWKRVWSGWWSAAALTCVALLFLVSRSTLLTTEPKIMTPGYVAIMSSEEKNNYFVLMAYKGDKPGKSSLRLKWNANYKTPEDSMGKAMLWAKDKITGEMSLVGHFAALQTLNPQLLSPDEWKAIKNSSELLITVNGNPNSQILFRGTCVELSSTES